MMCSISEINARELKQAREYISYLESQLPRAEVIDLPADQVHESATAGRELNPFFNKPDSGKSGQN